MAYREVTYRGESEKTLMKRLEEIKKRKEEILTFEIKTY